MDIHESEHPIIEISETTPHVAFLVEHQESEVSGERAQIDALSNEISHHLAQTSVHEDGDDESAPSTYPNEINQEEFLSPPTFLERHPKLAAWTRNMMFVVGMGAAFPSEAAEVPQKDGSTKGMVVQSSGGNTIVVQGDGMNIVMENERVVSREKKTKKESPQWNNEQKDTKEYSSRKSEENVVFINGKRVTMPPSGAVTSGKNSVNVQGRGNNIIQQ